MKLLISSGYWDSRGSDLRRFIISPKNGGDLCANGRVGQAQYNLELAILFVEIVWRDTKLLAENFFLKTPSPNPARIPSQTLPCGRKISRGRANPNPRPNVSPCRVLFSSFNHLDSARNNFELCPVSTATVN